MTSDMVGLLEHQRDLMQTLQGALAETLHAVQGLRVDLQEVHTTVHGIEGFGAVGILTPCYRNFQYYLFPQAAYAAPYGTGVAAEGPGYPRGDRGYRGLAQESHAP